MSRTLHSLPKFYAILDAGLLARRGVELADFARALRDAGVRLVQYRDKGAAPQMVLQERGDCTERLLWERLFAGDE